MGERGMAGILVLWLLVGASALAYGALGMAKRQEARGLSQIAETQALYLAHAGVQLAYAGSFPNETKHYDFATGAVSTRATPIDSNGLLTLHLFVQVSSLEKNFEIGWKRVSGQWQALYWREL